MNAYLLQLLDIGWRRDFIGLEVWDYYKCVYTRINGTAVATDFRKKNCNLVY